MGNYLMQLTGIKDLEGNAVEEILINPKILKNASDRQMEKLFMLRALLKKSFEKSTINKIGSSKDAYEFVKFLKIEAVEYFYVIYLKRNNVVIKLEKIAKGHEFGTIVDIKKIVESVARYKASSVILCHNHPSGNEKPSDIDIQLTTKVNGALGFLDSKVIDHIIVSGEKYYSMSDECINY